MNCPACGLLNLPSALICTQCKTRFDSTYTLTGSSRNVINLNRGKSAAAASASAAQPQPSAARSDWREQLTLRLERLKEKNSESPQLVSTAPVEDFRHREFVKPGKSALPGEESVDALPKRPEYHPLAEKALEKIDRASRSPVAPLETTLPILEAEPLRVPKRKRVPPRSERIERIEISLNQGTLPFEVGERVLSAALEDRLQTGLAAAPLSARVRAGMTDAVFVFGCFLIFLLIVFFVPDFAFLSRSSFVGMSLVGLLILTAYLYLFTALGNKTLGMEQEELQVVNFQGNPIDLREASLRCFGYVVSLGCFCLGFLWALFDPERLTWHDKISKTLIIQRQYPPSESNP